MSITIQLDLPDALAKEAQASGLLDSQSVTNLVAMELRRRKAGRELTTILEDIRSQPGQSVREEAIAEEIKALCQV